MQCPNWLDINRVFVLINGRLADEHDFRRTTHAKMFNDETIKFQQTVELELKSDAHIVVVTGGQGLRLGDVVGPGHSKTEPAAVANPIFVDVDGNGFAANKDTLGHPLPTRKN